MSHGFLCLFQVEEGTPFAKWYTPGASPMPSDDTAADMYEEASSVLRAAGYEHYELSNYAQPGHRCRHNMAYWEQKPYYAFGVGAASYLDGRRLSRPKSMQQYYAWLADYSEQTSPVKGIQHNGNNKYQLGATDAGPGVATLAPEMGRDAASAAAGSASTTGLENSGSNAVDSAHRRLAVAGSSLPCESPEERMLDTIMLRLRLRDGLDLAGLSSAYGEQTAAVVRSALMRYPVPDAIEGLGSQEQVCCVSTANVVRLSDPHGLLLSNDIISDVFAEFPPS